MARKAKPTVEERLAAYWRKKSKLQFSDFDWILGPESPAWDKKPRPTRVMRGEEIDFRLRNEQLDGLRGDARDQAMTKHLYDSVNKVADYIAMGLPLSWREFHIAIGLGYLITELPYEEFYKTRWAEDADGRGYGYKTKKAT